MHPQEYAMDDVEGARKRRCGREVRKALLAPAGQGETKALRRMWLVVAALVTFPTLACVCAVYGPPLAFIADAFTRTSHQQQRQVDDDEVMLSNGVTADAVFNRPSDVPRDEYLGGLLASIGFDESSCQSRYQSALYRKPSPHKPSAYLVQRLRKYEERHRRCSPNTASYNSTVKLLNAGSAQENETECKYVLWTPWGGLGNRILTLASTFLYALLTDRVLLIDPGEDMADLFCEPIPETTWLLPRGFPISSFDAYYGGHPRSYGNLLKNKKISKDGANGTPRLPSFVFLYLGDDYQTEDMQFFCEQDQAVLRRVPWLLVRSDLYFVPGLFLNKEFEPELSRLFPEKETVFHHLGRYLFHPTNRVWGMITRYYRAYLAMAENRLGMQIRVFSPNDAPFEVVSQQVINCTLKEKLLPEVDANEHSTDANAADVKKITTAVLVTSLYSGYADKIREMYSRENPAAGGAVVSVHQPTHEEKQQTGTRNHDERAWAEMYVLSLADVLVTSAWSTFGYVAQGLGGIRPWILLRPEKAVMPEPTCVRDISMEPCFHLPPSYVCREKKSGDNGKVVPFVTHCRDVSGGLKLVDRPSPFFSSQPG